MIEEEKMELLENIEEKYEIYAKNLKVQFAEKLALLKKKYKTLSEEEKQQLLAKAKSNSAEWKQISLILKEDKRKVEERNAQIRTLKLEYNKESESLQARREAEENNVEKDFWYSKVLAYREKGMKQIESDYQKMNSKYTKAINDRIRLAKSLQSHISNKKAALENFETEITNLYSEKFKKLCEEKKNDPSFTKRRIVIPKELLSNSGDSVSILESDLDKCIVTSKKEIAAQMYEDKKNAAIMEKGKEIRLELEEKLEQLENIKSQIEELKLKKSQAVKTRTDRIRLFNRKVARIAYEHGIDKVEKYSPEKTEKTIKAANEKKRFKEKTGNKFVNFVKGTALFQKIEKASNTRKEAQLEKMVQETTRIKENIAQEESSFFTSLSQNVNETPVYTERNNEKQLARNIVK